MSEAGFDGSPDPARVREIFEGARGLPGAERATYVAEACGGDDALRREIEELLEHLDELPTTFGDAETSADHSSVHATSEHLAPGTAIGSYTIEGLLGEGGMGSVYIARQDRPRRTVALKLIRGEWVSERMLRRFARESELLGRLQHPGIAQIYEAGMAKTPGGVRPFFAMEHVQGTALLEYADQGALSTRDRLSLLAKICDAVDHAHRAGVIHRDLKPANILVTSDGQPKVLDFGIARATDSDLQVTTVQTDVGQLIGTLPYMSPEQASGDVQSLDARSDVYALGVVGYQLLTGRLPYDLSGKMIHEAARVIYEVDPTPLSTLDRTLRGDVDTIIGKALEKERQRRYQSAADLGSDIDRYLSDKPITARPPSTIYQLRKFARRNKALVAGVAATFVVLVAGVIVSSSLAVGQARERRMAEARLQESEAVMNFLGDAFAAPRPQAAGFDVTAVQVLDAAAERIDDRFQGQPIARARAQYIIACTYRALSRNKEALPLLEAARDTQTTLLGPNDSSTLDTSLELAEVYRLVGRAEESGALFEQTIETLGRILGPDDSRTIDARINLANLYDDDPARYDEAAQIYIDARRLLDARGESSSRAGITCVGNLAIIRSQQGRTDEALALYMGAEELSRNSGEAGLNQRAIILTNLGSLRIGQRRHEEAEPYLREALAIDEKILGPDHEGTVIARSLLARVLRARAQIDETEVLQRQCIDGMSRIYGRDHPRTLIAENDLADTLCDAGRVDEALEITTSVVERARVALPPGHWFLGAFLLQDGVALTAAGRYAEADKDLLEAYDLYVAQFGPDHDRTLPIVRYIVKNHEAAGDMELAQEWRARLPAPEAAPESPVP